MVVPLARRWVLVDDEDLGTRAQLHRLQVTPPLAEQTAAGRASSQEGGWEGMGGDGRGWDGRGMGGDGRGSKGWDGRGPEGMEGDGRGGMEGDRRGGRDCAREAGGDGACVGREARVHEVPRRRAAAHGRRRAPDDAPLDQHVVPHVERRLLRAMDGLSYVADEVAAPRPVVRPPVELLLPRLWLLGSRWLLRLEVRREGRRWRHDRRGRWRRHDRRGWRRRHHWRGIVAGARVVGGRHRRRGRRHWGSGRCHRGWRLVTSRPAGRLGRRVSWGRRRGLGRGGRGLCCWRGSVCRRSLGGGGLACRHRSFRGIGGGLWLCCSSLLLCVVGSPRGGVRISLRGGGVVGRPCGGMLIGAVRRRRLLSRTVGRLRCRIGAVGCVSGWCWRRRRGRAGEGCGGLSRVELLGDRLRQQRRQPDWGVVRVHATLGLGALMWHESCVTR